jgi:hypothetical protein
MGGLPFFIKVFEMRGSGSESHRVSDARGGEGEKKLFPQKKCFALSPPFPNAILEFTILIKTT